MQPSGSSSSTSPVGPTISRPTVTSGVTISGMALVASAEADTSPRRQFLSPTIATWNQQFGNNDTLEEEVTEPPHICIQKSSKPFLRHHCRPPLLPPQPCFISTFAIHRVVSVSFRLLPPRITISDYCGAQMLKLDSSMTVHTTWCLISTQQSKEGNGSGNGDCSCHIASNGRPRILLMTLENNENQESGGSKKNFRWSDKSTIVLCDVLIEYIIKNGRGQFYKWRDIERDTGFRIGLGRPCPIDSCKHKTDAMRKEWRSWRALRIKETGLGWDPKSDKIDAPPEWWEKNKGPCV